MPNLDSFWKRELLWNSVGEWAIALIVFLAVFAGLLTLRALFRARRRKRLDAGRAIPVPLDLTSSVIEKTTRLFVWGVALYCAVEQLEFPKTSHIAVRIDRGVDILITLIFWYQVGLWAMAALRYSVDRRRRTSEGHDSALAGSMEIILFVAGILIWGLALLLALDNMGVAIRPLLAGLGIGGIAVALAVQAVLGDLLASMSIAMDKPFGLGDLLMIDALTGTVEYIGVKSTRIRSITGEQIVIANADITKSRIRNYGRMSERRVAFDIAVVHNTPVPVLRALPEAVQAVVEASPRRASCVAIFSGLSETALRFELVYYVREADYGIYAETQHAIMLALMEKFRQLGVQFPTPAQVPIAR